MHFVFREKETKKAAKRVKFCFEEQNSFQKAPFLKSTAETNIHSFVGWQPDLVFEVRK